MNITPTEADEGRALVAYMRLKGYKFAHIANETGHSPEARRRAMRVKQQGVSKGFPDYVVAANGHLYFIELKRVRGARVTPEQQDWIDAINQLGIPGVSAHICKGAGEVIKVLTGGHS